MEALVLWAEPHSPNLGVRALGDGCRALLQRVWPDVRVSMQGNGPGSSPVRIGNQKAIARDLLSREHALTDWIRGFDIVLDTRAGDSFSDIYGLRRLSTMSIVAELVGRAGVPLVMAPQTIGPFGTRRGRALGRRSLSRASRVMVRDSISAGYAAGLGRTVDACATDVVFALDVPTVERTRDVVLNVSGLLWEPNPHVDSGRYQQLVRSLCSELIKRGRHLTLLPHVLDSPAADNDVPVSLALAAEFDIETAIPQSLADAREILASAQVAVGSRMHACLNALSVGTPAIPLAYSRKFQPLLNDLGWYHTIDLRSGVDETENAVRAIFSDALAAGVGSVRDRAAALLEPAVRALASLW